MISRSLKRLPIVVALLALSGSSALAQYDRDGRYVPSPNGIPADPYARPIPLYPGTPGQAIGTPSLPRNAYPPPQVIAPLQSPPVRTYPAEAAPVPHFVPLTAEACRIGWRRETGLTRAGFKRRCAGLSDP